VRAARSERVLTDRRKTTRPGSPWRSNSRRAVGAVRETATDICGCSFGFRGRRSEDEDEEGSGDRFAFIASFLEQGFGTSLPLGLGFSMTCGVRASVVPHESGIRWVLF
jgi:hypothetical protein